MDYIGKLFNYKFKITQFDKSKYYSINKGYKKRSKLFRLIRLIVWDMLICGILQPIGALSTALFVCPVASLCVTLCNIHITIWIKQIINVFKSIHFLVAIVRKIRRAVSDGIFFHTIIRCNAKVPSNDTFIARRVAGPGLASDYFYQVFKTINPLNMWIFIKVLLIIWNKINPEQALAALETQIEINLLNTYQTYIEKIIKEPTRLYKWDLHQKIY